MSGDDLLIFDSCASKRLLDAPTGVEPRPTVVSVAAGVLMFLPRLFRPFGPLWVAFVAYPYWRRLSPQRKAEIKERVRGLTRLVSPSGDLPR